MRVSLRKSRVLDQYQKKAHQFRQSIPINRARIQTANNSSRFGRKHKLASLLCSPVGGVVVTAEARNQPRAHYRQERVCLEQLPRE